MHTLGPSRRVSVEEILAFEALADALAGIAPGQRHSLHTDPGLGKAQGLGGQVASGMLVFGWVEGLLHEAWGQWPPTCELGLRFRSPVRPGDEITASWEPDAEGGFTAVVINQRGEQVALGSCRGPLPAAGEGAGAVD